MDSLLLSIQKQNKNIKFEVLIANQTDQKILKSNFFFDTKEILVSTNSLSLSRNKLIDISKGDYLVFLDDDCIIDDKYLDILEKEIVNKSYPSFISGNIYNLDNNKIYNRNLKEKYFIHNKYSFSSCLSSNMTIKKIDILKIGNFDENFGIGAKYHSNEESDVLIRFIEAGFKSIHSPCHKVFHPRFDESKLSNSMLIERSYKYGLGRGSLLSKYKKNNLLWFYSQTFKFLLIPFLLIFYNSLLFRKNKIIRYYYTLLGRIVGLKNYES